MKYILLLVTLSFTMLGCVKSANRTNLISVGMTKQKVIEILGAPRSSAAQGSIEYMNYAFFEMYDNSNKPADYFVRILDGKVESFGKRGDFDSTKDPTVNLNIKNR